MKQSPSERSLHDRLKASKFSAEGFLGRDTRSVDEIISVDKRRMEEHGIDPEQLINRLLGVFETAREAFGAEVDIKDGVTVTFHESMGRIPSPFRGEGVFEKGEATVHENGIPKLRITRLGLHLIKKHLFFQGEGRPYRIDPVEADRILPSTGSKSA